MDDLNKTFSPASGTKHTNTPELLSEIYTQTHEQQMLDNVRIHVCKAMEKMFAGIWTWMDENGDDGTTRKDGNRRRKNRIAT